MKKLRPRWPYLWIAVSASLVIAIALIAMVSGQQTRQQSAPSSVRPETGGELYRAIGNDPGEGA